MRHRLEYAAVRVLVFLLGALPRPLARAAGIVLARLVYALHGRLRRVGMRNLELAFPEKPLGERRRILKGVFNGFGRQLAEFAHFPDFDQKTIAELAVYDGFEHFEAARAKGKGVLFLTAHLGGWEIGSFAHSLYGNPLHIVVRPLDNPYLDAFVDKYRTLHGNTTFGKQDFARGIIAATRMGETVGLLMDQNMTPPAGVFVDFFGIPACTAAGIARVAAHTEAAVVPGFTLWDPERRKYRIHFEPAVELVRSGNDDADAVANTAKFTKIIEEFARQYPDQWLWVHRRWKTRPEGATPLY